jgi:hypothetical protein
VQNPVKDILIEYTEVWTNLYSLGASPPAESDQSANLIKLRTNVASNGEQGPAVEKMCGGLQLP